MKKFVVIGGQYEPNYIGQSDSIHGAKVIAGKNKEYFDNWQGWRTPHIYRAEDCEEREANGYITLFEGARYIFPKEGAEPIF